MTESLQEFTNNIYNEDSYWGRMTNPTTFARIEGPCGDDIEFYLIIKDDIIQNVKFYTEMGCIHTKIAGRAVAAKVKNKNIYDALTVNPGIIIKEEAGLNNEGKHCAILATTTFYRAIAMYLLDI